MKKQKKELKRYLQLAMIILTVTLSSFGADQNEEIIIPNVTKLYQNDYQEKLDSSDKTIAEAGCSLTALTMLINQALAAQGLHKKNPDGTQGPLISYSPEEINTLLNDYRSRKDKNGWGLNIDDNGNPIGSSTGIVTGALLNAVKTDTKERSFEGKGLQQKEHHQPGMCGIPDNIGSEGVTLDENYKYIHDELKAGRPVVVLVRYKYIDSEGKEQYSQHYVLIKSFEQAAGKPEGRGRYDIADPWKDENGNSIEYLDNEHYQNKIYGWKTEVYQKGGIHDPYEVPSDYWIDPEDLYDPNINPDQYGLQIIEPSFIFKTDFWEYIVYDSDPADGAQSVPPSTTILSWKRKFFNRVPPQVELHWGSADDPNFWIHAPEKIMDLADVNSFDLADAIGGPIVLEPEREYFWAVKYEDPNDGNWGAGLIEGLGWSFDTINRPPVVNAGLHADRWLPSVGSVKVSLDASYTDDGLPVGGNLTYTWSETLSGGATTPGYDSRNVEDPNVTFSTAGDYLLTLTIHDDEGSPEDEVSIDTTLIRIFANSDDRLRAHYPLDTNVLDSDNSDPCDTHNGTIHDNPVWGIGQVAGAIELDGTDDVPDGFGDFISIDDTGSDPNWQPDTWENSDLIDGMTVLAWMKLDQDGWSKGWESIVAKSTDSWELSRAGNGSDVNFTVKGSVGTANSSGTDVTSGWHQVAGVFDRNAVKFYVDGLETDSTTAGAVQAPKSAGKILIGNTNNPSINPTNDFTFGGLIDQVRIFDAAVPHRAEHSNTPGIVEMYRADGGHDNCGGVYLPGDLNEDCYVTLADFALVAKDWLDCNDVSNPSCDD